MFIIEKIFVSTLIQAGSYPLASPTACQEARPEAVGSVGLNGMIAGSKQGEIIASRGLVHRRVVHYSRLLITET